MNIIKGLLSTVILAVGLFLEYVVFSVLVDNTIESSTQIATTVFGVLILFPMFLFVQWLWRKPTKQTQTTSIPTNSSESPEVVVKVPVGIQYKLELSSPDPVITQIPEILSSQYEFKVLKGFPGNLFCSESYNGWNSIVALLLVLSVIYFLTGFPGFLSIQNNLSDEGTSGLIPVVWNYIFGGGASSKISSTFDLSIRFFVFMFTYCIAWISFDPKEAEVYAMGVFNILIGALYIFVQIDTIPDIVPIIGMLDDAILGTGMILLGASGCYKAKIREATTDTALQLISKGNSSSAIEILLKGKGITVQDKQ